MITGGVFPGDVFSPNAVYVRPLLAIRFLHLLPFQLTRMVSYQGLSFIVLEGHPPVPKAAGLGVKPLAKIICVYHFPPAMIPRVCV